MTAMAAGPAILTERDDGQAIQLRVGERITLELPETAGTGYRWALEEPVPAALEVREEPFRPSSSMPGSRGTATWTLLALVPGDVDLRLKLWRSWEGDASIRQRFGATLHIRP